MTNAEIMQAISHEMLELAPECCHCDRDTALYEGGAGEAVCYDCAPDKESLTDIGRVYQALERRFK